MPKIIVIEGTDGSGKQTQANKLKEALEKQGKKVLGLSFPNYQSPSSAPVKMYLGGEFGDANSLDAYQSSALFAVDRLCTIKQYKKQIQTADYVILDRYTQSNMLHQAGKILDVNQKDKFLDWLVDFEFNTLKLPKVNMVIFLDVPTSVSKKLAEAREGLKAGTKRDVHECDVNHLENAYQSGKYVAKKFGWHVIDCTKNGQIKSISEIANQIFNIVVNQKEITK